MILDFALVLWIIHCPWERVENGSGWEDPNLKCKWNKYNGVLPLGLLPLKLSLPQFI